MEVIGEASPRPILSLFRLASAPDLDFTEPDAVRSAWAGTELPVREQSPITRGKGSVYVRRALIESVVPILTQDIINAFGTSKDKTAASMWWQLYFDRQLILPKTFIPVRHGRLQDVEPSRF